MALRNPNCESTKTLDLQGFVQLRFVAKVATEVRAEEEETLRRMPATPSANKKDAFTLLAFTPRQVLLLTNQTMKQSSSNFKLLLHHSIARYLERSSFSKTLKKFRKEAQIEKDNVEDMSIDLEEMCLKYLEIRLKDTALPVKWCISELCISGTITMLFSARVMFWVCKCLSSMRDKDAKSNIQDQKDQAVNGTQSGNKEGKSKDKKKKKNKLDSESLASLEDNQVELQTKVTEQKGKDEISADDKIVDGAEAEKKSKDKKKKKKKENSQADAVEETGGCNGTVSKKDNSKASNREVMDEEKKDTKKRKRPTSEENGQQVADKKAAEEPKRRKVENLDESKGGEKLAETSVDLGNDSNSSQENVANGHTNGQLESAGGKSSAQKSQKKQQMESAETSAKKAFQRVQVDKVQFADERLQDNSYWAKSGAEVGYGAKAEEILGQVRGRDFRHEKTKKKRGSYRGGQIDLQSHSVKFNYSDEE
ncbi:hypothetical protein Ahy_B01g055015 isoform A [Arachis hypogaea]|uniref:Srp40 C-terminal domain-containing protein n=1 Tax=Arachis hypogaea TaxID=3818 RepID=A0A445AUU6_ARAHY|nr:hypothetical protein Ahy_B01g055015 isoform A [Arachis hypogaea]